MTSEAKEDFVFAFYIKTYASIVFQSIFKVQTLFPPIFIPDKYACEVGINVIITSEKLNFYSFMVSLYCSKNVRKKWKKIIHPRRIEKSHPWSRNFNQGLSKPHPWLKFWPRVRFSHPIWTLMMDSCTLTPPSPGLSPTVNVFRFRPHSVWNSWSIPL